MFYLMNTGFYHLIVMYVFYIKDATFTDKRLTQLWVKWFVNINKGGRRMCHVFVNTQPTGPRPNKRSYSTEIYQYLLQNNMELRNRLHQRKSCHLPSNCFFLFLNLNNISNMSVKNTKNKSS